jgi:2-dehydropantoate 2-reductase
MVWYDDGMTASTETQLAVLGSGAIGGLLAAQLAHAGERVVLWGREPGISAIASEGLTIEGAVTLSQPVTTASGALPRADLYLVATKTPCNPELITRMVREIPPHSRVLVCQNGLDPERDFAEALGAERVFRAIFYLGATRVAPSRIVVSFWSRPTLIGGPGDAAAGTAIAQLLDHAGHQAAYTPEIRKFAWEKVILNAITNPLCALGGRTISEVMEDPRFMPVLHEAMAVAAADGVELSPGFEEQALHLLAKTGNHRGSMWEDVKLGRPTEIEPLNGRIVALGERLGVPVSANRALVEAVRRLVPAREAR